ncbi:hypothetical protein K2X30_11205 [bacterium]|jgi:hypothetical protein|nr:hypothetical protein [bacterium]
MSRRQIKTVFAIFFGIQAMSCGAIRGSTVGTPGNNIFNNGGTTYEDGTLGGTGGTTNPTTTNPTVGTQQLFNFNVQGTGYNAYTFTVPTRTVLKLTFTPGMQDRPISGTGYMVQYSKLAVYIKVNNQEIATPLLKNGLSGTAQQTTILDFSGSINSSCDANDVNCSQVVTITVYKPNYDYHCYNFNLYCTHTQVLDQHPWNGVLKVQTNNTVALQ